MSALGVKRTSAALLSEKEPGRERAPSRDPAVMPQHCSAGREGEKPESKRYRRSHKGVVRQLGDIRRDPARLIGGYQGHSAGTHRKVAWRKRSLEREPSNASCPCLYYRCWSVRSRNDRPRARRNFWKGARQKGIEKTRTGAALGRFQF